MTVEKITSPITPNELIDKTNEIIDNLSDASIDTTLLNYYGTCSTAAATQAKDVVCPEFMELKTGISIRVKFTNAQSYNGAPTLNVNSTGAKSVKSIGTTNAVRYCWLAGEIVSFTYDGTNWVMEDAGIATTSYYGYTKLTTSATSTNAASALTPISLNNLVENMIEPYPVYSASTTYEVGDKVRYSYQAWECITTIATAETWNANHWKALEPIQTQIDDISNKITVKTFRGTFNNFGDVPTDVSGYKEDAEGSNIPVQGDLIVVNDMSDYISSDYTKNNYIRYEVTKVNNLLSELTLYLSETGTTRTVILNEVLNKYLDIDDFITIYYTPVYWIIYAKKNVIYNGTSYTATEEIVRVPNVLNENGIIYSLDSEYKNKWLLEYDGTWSVDSVNAWSPIYNLGSNIYITEMYQNGTSWYKIYSNGWCEQGGITAEITGNTNNINLLKAYVDLSYGVQLTVSSNVATTYTPAFNKSSVSSFNIGVYTDTVSIYWRAEGYIN